MKKVYHPSESQDALHIVETVLSGISHEINNRSQTILLTAQVLLEVDSQAKVQMRHKVRGLRSLERQMLARELPTDEAPGLTPEQQADAARIVLDYCAIVRGILNDNHGGPLRPAGWRMAEIGLGVLLVGLVIAVIWMYRHKKT